jgi:hypothetical protein
MRCNWLTPISYSYSGQNKNENKNQIFEEPTSNKPYADTPLSISEEKKSEITVKPNPTTGQLIINSEQLTIERIEIDNIYGQNIGKYFCGRNEIIIDISRLSNGMYFLKVYMKDGTQKMKKIVKQ